MNKIAPYAKAVVGALVAGLSAIATSLDDNGLSAQEIVTAVIAFLVGLGVVYGVPNKPATGGR